MMYPVIVPVISVLPGRVNAWLAEWFETSLEAQMAAGGKQAIENKARMNLFTVNFELYFKKGKRQF